MSKCLGGIIGCKLKTSSWHLNEFPDGSNIGSRVYCRGGTRRYAGTPDQNKTTFLVHDKIGL